MSFSLTFSTIPDGDYDAELELDVSPSGGAKKLSVTYKVAVSKDQVQAVSPWPMFLDAAPSHPDYVRTVEGKQYVAGLLQLTGQDATKIKRASDIVEMFSGITLRVRVRSFPDKNDIKIPKVVKVLKAIKDNDGSPFESSVKGK